MSIQIIIKSNKLIINVDHVSKESEDTIKLIVNNSIDRFFENTQSSSKMKDKQPKKIDNSLPNICKPQIKNKQSKTLDNSLSNFCKPYSKKYKPKSAWDKLNKEEKLSYLDSEIEEYMENGKKDNMWILPLSGNYSMPSIPTNYSMPSIPTNYSMPSIPTNYSMPSIPSIIRPISPQ